MRPFSNALRLFTVLNTFAHYRIYRMFPRIRGSFALRAIFLFFPGRWLPCKAPKNARLQLALEQLGPFYIKMGQLLATRADLFPDELLKELQKLQDQVKPFDTKVAQRLLQNAMNKRAHVHITNVAKEPLAAGSIAQVYEATYINGANGEIEKPVILKLLRPNVEQIIRKDMILLKRFSHLINRVWKDAELFQIDRVIQDYEQILLDELDLLQEAKKTERMRYNFRDIDDVYIPEVYMDLCSKQLLVEERINGIPVNNLDELDAAGIDLPKLARSGVEIFFTQVFEHNYFHADMHPGNIFVNPDRPEKPQYMTIDCAIIGSLTEQDQILLGKMIISLVQEEYAQLIQIIARAGWLPPHADIPQITKTTEEILQPIAQGNMASMGFAESIMGLLQVVREHRIKMPIEFMLLLKTLIHIEGLGRQIYPNLDVWPIATPIVREWLNKKLGFKATYQKLKKQTPIMLNAISEMPNFMLDAPKQLRTIESNIRALDLIQEEERARQIIRRRRLFHLNIISAIAVFGCSVFMTPEALADLSFWFKMAALWLFLAAIISRK